MAFRVLITGATGFVGGHLAEALLSRDEYEIHGLSRGGVWPAECAHLAGNVRLHQRDLADPVGLPEFLADVQPRWIFHLAGFANPRRSREEPSAARRNNLDAARCLYEAVSRWRGTTRILAVSTGQVYGRASGVCDESTPIQPENPYSQSKAEAERAGLELAASGGLDLICVRPFNHTGPRQPTGYVVPDFASQIAEIERGAKPACVKALGLNAFLDLTDVRDVVRAYILLMAKGRNGEVYNIGCGRLVRCGDLLTQLLSMSSVPEAMMESQTDSRPRESGAPICNAGKLRRETGWQPQIPLEQTLRDTLEYWRSANKRNAS